MCFIVHFHFPIFYFPFFDCVLFPISFFRFGLLMFEALPTPVANRSGAPSPIPPGRNRERDPGTAGNRGGQNPSGVPSRFRLGEIGEGTPERRATGVGKA